MSAEACRLGPELTLQQVAQAHEQLLQAYASGVRQFDLGGLESIDGAGAQLLLALQKTAEAEGESLAWSPASGPAARTLTVLGLGHLTSAGTQATGAAG